MMTISIEEVNRIAKLARFQIEESEKENLARQLSEIVNYFDKLNELDTTNVEPISHPHEVTNVLREDIAKESLPIRTALENAPQKNDKYFIVPRVITK